MLGFIDGQEALPDTRRARLRRELTAEIISHARRQLEQGGPAAVTWRGIARSVEMSPASLYTYFASLDDVFTELLVQSYQALSRTIRDDLGAFESDPVGDRLLVGPLTYRRWALENPAQFNLIFTDQIPGYAAPPDGPTVRAQLAVFEPMIEVFARAHGSDPRPELVTEQSAERDQFLGLWGTFHGLTILEINHHLHWLDAAELYEKQIRWQLDQLGLPTAHPNTSNRLTKRCPSAPPRSASRPPEKAQRPVVDPRS